MRRLLPYLAWVALVVILAVYASLGGSEHASGMLVLVAFACISLSI